MKKKMFLGFITLAALATTSCSNDDFVNKLQDEQAITFGTYLGRDAQGRGVVLDNDNLLDFGVFAAYTGQTAWSDANTFNFMFNQKVARTSNTAAWEYTPLKYWPTTKNDMITFFAYAPYPTTNNGISVVSTNASAGVPQIKYTIAEANGLDNAADFTADVLYNETKVGDGNSIDSQDRTVSFTLAHELTRVGMQAKLDRDAFGDAAANKTQVNIKEITFSGTAFAKDATYTFGNADNARGTWTLGTQAATLNLATLLDNATSTESLGGYTVEGVRVPNTTLVNLFGADNYLFLIPTNGTTGAVAETVTITVSYDIVTIDAALKDGYSCTPAVKTFAAPTGALKQGSAYNYILTFGLNEIKLSASVADWDENTLYEDVDWTLLQ